MTTKAVVRKCEIKAIVCLETNHMDQWFYENLNIVGEMVVRGVKIISEDISISEEYSSEVKPRPVDSIYVIENYSAVAYFKRTFDETISFIEKLSFSLRKQFEDVVNVSEDMSKSLHSNFLIPTYALGTIELGSRELNPGSLGLNEDEIKIEESFSIVLTV